jgi:uncharacterized protein DUF4384
MRRRHFLTAIASAAGLLDSACSRPDTTKAAETGGSGGVPPATAKAEEKQIDYCLELDDPSGPRKVKESRQFRSGERFRFRFRPGFESHIYLLNRGPGENSWTVLFPNPRIEIKNPIHAGNIVTIPDKDTGWLRIDERKGNEHLVLIAATDPLEEFAVATGRVSRDDFEDRIANIERLYRPASSRRFEDDQWVKLFAAGPSDKLAIVLSLPLLHA